MNVNNEIFINIYYLLLLNYTRYYNIIIIYLRLFYKCEMIVNCIHNIILYSSQTFDRGTLNKTRFIDYLVKMLSLLLGLKIKTQYVIQCFYF